MVEERCSAVQVVCGAAILALATAVTSIAQEKIDITLAGYKPPAVRGKTTELKASGSWGKTFSLQSVEVVPPDGVSVTEIRENAPRTAAAGDRKLQQWSIFVAVEKTAQLGDRQLVFTTPAGRSTPRDFVVASHVPVIADLKARRVGSDMSIGFVAADEAGDLSDLSLSYVLMCGGSISSSNMTIKGYFDKNPKGGRVEVTLGSIAVGPGRFISSGSCTSVEVSIDDKNGYSSNELRSDQIGSD